MPFPYPWICSWIGIYPPGPAPFDGNNFRIIGPHSFIIVIGASDQCCMLLNYLTFPEENRFDTDIWYYGKARWKPGGQSCNSAWFDNWEKYWLLPLPFLETWQCILVKGLLSHLNSSLSKHTKWHPAGADKIVEYPLQASWPTQQNLRADKENYIFIS